MNKDNPVWWGNCEDCDARVYVARDEELPDADEWEAGAFPDCYVCGGTLAWGGSDPERSILR